MTTPPQTRRRQWARLAVLPTVIAALVALALPVPTAEAKRGSCGRPSGCTRYELIHAGATYDWYPAGIRHEFESRAGRVPPRVFTHTGSPAAWRTQRGTLYTEATQGDVATEWHQARVRGRWEVRFRSRTGTWRVPTGTPYAVQMELVPAGAPLRCAPESIVMASYDPAVSRRTATIGVRRPGFQAATTVRAVGPLSDVTRWNKSGTRRHGAWRAWAVEVGRDHISWFLDGRVVRRENRPAALIGKRLHLRISLLAKGPGMAPATTQLDWTRYWSLKRTTKAKKKVRALRRAPGLTQSRNPVAGC